MKMVREENTPITGTIADLLVQNLRDEKDNEKFVDEYLKAGFLASAVDALFYARRNAGLTQEQVAQKLGKKQEAIARWEADTDGKMSLRQYVEIALACGMIPLDIKLEPVNSVRDYVFENPEAPRTQDLYDAWIKKRSEPISAAQPTTAIALTTQAVINDAPPINRTISIPEGRQAVKYVEQSLRDVRQVSQPLPKWTGEGVTNTASVSDAVTQNPTTENSARSAIRIDKVVA
jgi:transcriptional regulator with XRE-family HTH domain